MPYYRRSFVAGATYFFTLVTANRTPLFWDEQARTILGDKFRLCQSTWPFHVDAMVLLPDHLHLLITLPPEDIQYPARIDWVKKEFTKSWLAEGATEQPLSVSRKADRRQGVWQPKYWEHTVRDEQDFECHVEYSHFNPVKHGYVNRASEWEFSTIHAAICSRSQTLSL